MGTKFATATVTVELEVPLAARGTLCGENEKEMPGIG